jgi:hypothetical protein
MRLLLLSRWVLVGWPRFGNHYLHNKAYGRKGVAGLIAPKPCGFLNVLDKGVPLWKAMNFPRSGGRSQAGKRRMREIRPSGDRRKGPLLNSGAALRRQPRSCLWMCCRRLKGGGDAFALLHLGLTSRFRGKDFLLGLSCFNLLVVLIHSVIPFLKFCAG